MAESLNQPIVYDFVVPTHSVMPISIGSGLDMFWKTFFGQAFQNIFVACQFWNGITDQ
jgi:hypothetical protein